MKPMRIPINFILDRTSLTWQEAVWGIEHQWLTRDSLIDLALARLESGSVEHREIMIAGLTKADSWEASDLARELAGAEQARTESSVRSKWLFLILAYVFEYRSEFLDPLALVEEIHCDFGHPAEIEGFVRYMPEPPDSSWRPADHTQAENEAMMLSRWTAYLEAKGKEFSGDKG